MERRPAAEGGGEIEVSQDEFWRRLAEDGEMRGVLQEGGFAVLFHFCLQSEESLRWDIGCGCRAQEDHAHPGAETELQGAIDGGVQKERGVCREEDWEVVGSIGER